MFARLYDDRRICVGITAAGGNAFSPDARRSSARGNGAAADGNDPGVFAQRTESQSRTRLYGSWPTSWAVQRINDC